MTTNPQIIEKADGSLVVDARFEVDDFEERYGAFLTAEEREEVETLGGLAFFLAGHVPKKGEVFKHSCGMVLEIMDANASRVNRIRIRNLPCKAVTRVMRFNPSSKRDKLLYSLPL